MVPIRSRDVRAARNAENSNPFGTTS